MELGRNIALPLNLFPFSNIVIVVLSGGGTRGVVGSNEGREGREGRDRDNDGNDDRVERGEPGGDELGELVLSEVHDLLPLFLYFLFLFLFFSKRD